MARVPTCWFANELNEESSRVLLACKEAPWPTPEPVYPSLISEHQMMAGNASPGATKIQDFGIGSGAITFVIPFCTLATLEAIYVFYKAWTNGRRPKVHFSNSRKVWKCTWKGCVPTPRDLPEKFSVQIELAIDEEVS